MSTRLQVVIDDEELDEIRRVARRQGLTVSEWVRQTLRQARRTTSSGSVERKLAAVRAAARHEFPTGDVDEVLDEIEQGYLRS
jgi:hypothetical protein